MMRETKAWRRIHSFWSFLPWTLAMSHCSEEDWKEKTKKKRCVTTQQMNTSSIPSTSPCLQIFIAPGDSGFIENLGACVHTKIYSKIQGMCSHQNLGRCTGSPKLREACVSVECHPNFQHCPHHLLCWEPSYTSSSSLMRAP